MSIERLNEAISISSVGQIESQALVYAKVNELVDAHNTLEAQVREVAGSAWREQWDSQPAGGGEVVDA